MGMRVSVVALFEGVPHLLMFGQKHARTVDADVPEHLPALHVPTKRLAVESKLDGGPSGNRSRVQLDALRAASTFQSSSDLSAPSGPSSWFFCRSEDAPAAAPPPVALPPQPAPAGRPRQRAPNSVNLLHSPPEGLADTKGKVIKFTNCRLVRGHALVRDDLWIR